jgi:hypothetical protein
MLVKPAPNVPQCSIALQVLFDEAGLGNYVKTIFQAMLKLKNY